MVVVVVTRRNNTLQMAMGLLHHNKDIRKFALETPQMRSISLTSCAVVHSRIMAVTPVRASNITIIRRRLLTAAMDMVLHLLSLITMVDTM
jgi:hypothetical protein